MDKDDKLTAVCVVGGLLLILIVAVSVGVARSERWAWFTKCMEARPVEDCTQALEALKR